VVPFDTGMPRALTTIMLASPSRTFHSVRCAGSASGVFLELGISCKQTGRGPEILRPATLRTPAAVVKAKSNRDIERSAVNAGSDRRR
jgi:hypothetical protein